MKIAIAAEGKTEDDNVSSVYGRADFFLIFEDDKLVKTLKNPFKFGGGGAGFGVTHMLAKEKVKLIIAGKLGEKVLAVLEEKKIKYEVVSNKKVKEIIKNRSLWVSEI